MAKVARSADWIKLSYENQKPAQQLVTVLHGSLCVSRFEVPTDTVVWESSRLVLKGEADCASEWYWSGIEGPVPRMIDPAVKTLEIWVPEMEKDTVLRLRFSAKFGDSLMSKDMLVKVLKAVPTRIFPFGGSSDANRAQTKAGLGKLFSADGRRMGRLQNRNVHFSK